VTDPGDGVAGDGVAAYGVDVGGTKTLGVAIGRGGAVLAERRVQTPSQVATTSGDSGAGGAADAEGAHLGEAVADAIAALLLELQSDVRAGGRLAEGTTVPVGIGIAGLVDAAGVLRFSPNLPAASGVAIGTLVSERVGEALACTGVHTYNDANCTGLAELVLGAARGTRDGLVVTLGTGIGGALIVDGRVFVGSGGLAGEVGHMVIDPDGPLCTCGKRGCWERYASGGALARLAREAALAGTLHEPVRLAGGDPELVTGEHVTAAAAAGDAEARRVMEELGWWVGLGLANLVAILDPERIVVGGGLGHVGDMLLGPTRQSLGRLVVGARTRAAVPVVEAALGVQGGAVGAALAARAEVSDAG
jgi:glucokinase